MLVALLTLTDGCERQRAHFARRFHCRSLRHLALMEDEWPALFVFFLATVAWLDRALIRTFKKLKGPNRDACRDDALRVG